MVTCNGPTDYSVPDELAILLDGIRSFLDREVRRREEANAQLMCRRSIGPELFELAREVQRRSVEAGYYGMSMPVDAGGQGLGELEMCMVREVVAGSDTLLSFLMLGDLPYGPNRMLLELNTPYQQERFFSPLMRGEKLTAIALTEPEAGSDLLAVRASATRVSGGYRLSGSKLFISFAPWADFLMVFARMADGKGHSIFLVERESPGYTVGRILESMGGDDLQAEVFFDDVFVPAANIVGEEGQAFTYAMRFLGSERLAIASTAIGIAQFLCEAMVRQATSRRQFGRAIGANQAIQWMVADSLTELYAARSMCHDCARRSDSGEEVLARVSMVKLFATEAVGRIADRAVQVFGGMGYMRESPVEHYYRLVRALRIGGGTSEIQRMVIAGSAGLREDGAVSSGCR